MQMVMRRKGMSRFQARIQFSYITIRSCVNKPIWWWHRRCHRCEKTRSTAPTWELKHKLYSTTYLRLSNFYRSAKILCSDFSFHNSNFTIHIFWWHVFSYFMSTAFYIYNLIFHTRNTIEVRLSFSLLKSYKTSWQKKNKINFILLLQFINLVIYDKLSTKHEYLYENLRYETLKMSSLLLFAENLF